VWARLATYDFDNTTSVLYDVVRISSPHEKRHKRFSDGRVFDDDIESAISSLCTP
jgi:hypothetical protein